MLTPAAQPSASAALRATGRGPYLAALAFIAACHLPSLGFGFLLWDDGLHVTENPLVIAPGSTSLREQLTTPRLGYPIPVTIASYRLQAALTGAARAWPFHLGNVMIHVACSALVLAMALRLGLSPAGAVTAMFVYGLHPVVAEPVSWISGRKDLLAGLFALLTLWLGMPPARGWRRAGSVACYLLALLSKPSAAPVFLLLPALELWLAPQAFGHENESRATRVRRAARGVLPYLIVLVPVVVLGVIGQQGVGAVAGAEREGASWLRSTSFGLGLHVALLLLWEPATVKYLPSPWPPGFVPHVDLAAPFLFGAIAFALWRPSGQPRRAALFALVWAALTYLPSSGIIPLSRQFADSYVYMPLIGFAWLLGVGVDALVRGAPAAVRPWVAAWPWLIAILLAMLLLPSAARFHDDEALWAHARARFPQSARVCRQWANGVGVVHGTAAGLGATDDCIAQFGSALFVKNRGVLLYQLGRFAEARPWLERARADNPGDPTTDRYLRSLAAPASK